MAEAVVPWNSMSHRWASNTWVKINRAFLVKQTLASKSAAASLPLSTTSHFRIHVQQPVCYKTDFLSWKHIHQLRLRGRKGWIFKANQVRQQRLGFHTSTLYLNTSASRWSAGLNQHMSRVRSTLDTVSKAVGGTHSDLMSKIARLKPNARKKVEANVESAVKAEESAVTSTPAPPSASAAPSSSSASLPLSTSPAAATEASATTSAHPHSPTQATVSATILTVRELKEKRLRRVVPVVKATCARKQDELPPALNESKNTASKQTTELFHPSTFSVSLDETYNYLANHINSYFSSSTKTQDNKVDNSSTSSQDKQTSELVSVTGKTDPAAPVTPTSSKKSLGQYLSYSAPTVQAFVGNYIAPLVPKFRTGESKRAALEEKKKPDDASPNQAETAVSKEQKAAEEKAKKLLLQREKVCLKQSTTSSCRKRKVIL